MSAADSPVRRPPASPASDGVSGNQTILPLSTFDILPTLYDLLSRLLPSPTDHEAPLEAHQLTIEASSLKIKLLKARAAVASLPDVDRSVEQQEEEIGRLETTIRQQREMLAGLSRKAQEAFQDANEGRATDDHDGGKNMTSSDM
ncbi:MAG: hypothetical protein M1815_004394 [Lichina confinis]|nr:MAG: hypothetical protein M1815_004394 [Lichina confinis]